MAHDLEGHDGVITDSKKQDVRGYGKDPVKGSSQQLGGFLGHDTLPHSFAQNMVTWPPLAARSDRCALRHSEVLLFLDVTPKV